jgi:hypothetical protein
MSPAITHQPTTGPSYLSYLALNRSAAPAPPTVSSDTAIPPSPSVRTAKTGRSSSVRNRVFAIFHATTTIGDFGSDQTPFPPTTKQLSPRLYFSHFMDYLDHFVVFLEKVTRRR